MKVINDYLNNEYHNALMQYYDILLNVFDSLNVLHFKRKISLNFKAQNGKITIPFQGKVFYIEMPISNGTDKISHSQLQSVLLNIQTLKEIKTEIENYKKGIKGLHPQTQFNFNQ